MVFIPFQQTRLAVQRRHVKKVLVPVLWMAAIVLAEQVVGSEVLFEPAAGVGVTALILGGLPYASVVFLGAFGAGTLSGAEYSSAVMTGLVDTAVAVSGYWMVARFLRVDCPLYSRKSLILFSRY